MRPAQTSSGTGSGAGRRSLPLGPDKCVIDVTLMTPMSAGEGTSGPSQSPVAGRDGTARRHAESRCARSPCSLLSLHQAPVRPPRPAAPSAPQHGVYHDTVRSHPAPRSRHPLSACSPLLYHMYPRSPSPAPLPCSPCPERVPFPLILFFLPGAAHPRGAPYISLWTAAAPRRPGPPRVAPPIPSPDPLHNQRAESKGTAALGEPGGIRARARILEDRGSSPRPALIPGR